MNSIVGVLGYSIKKRVFSDTLFAATSSAALMLHQSSLDSDCIRAIIAIIYHLYGYAIMSDGDTYHVRGYTVQENISSGSGVAEDNKYLLFVDGSRPRMSPFRECDADFRILYRNPKSRVSVYLGVVFESAMPLADLAQNIAGCTILHIGDGSDYVIAREVEVTINDNTFEIVSNADNIINGIIISIGVRVGSGAISGRIVGEPVVERHHYLIH